MANHLLAERQRLRERQTVEWVNGRLEDEFSGWRIQVRSHMKVVAPLMFGICAPGSYGGRPALQCRRFALDEETCDVPPHKARTRGTDRCQGSHAVCCNRDQPEELSSNTFAKYLLLQSILISLSAVRNR